MSSKRILCAIDFDDTLICENSDLYIKQLLKAPMSAEALATYDSHNWTKYMEYIFNQLYEEGTTKHQIFDCLDAINMVDGMPELLKFLKSIFAEIIIISDANQMFIEHIMNTKKLLPLIDKVYTNPANFDDSGCLRITPYHYQDICDLGSHNLCKGMVLDDHIKANGPYDFVCYIGDGSNDYCPSLRLRKTDLTCARNGRSLAKLLDKNPEKLISHKLVWSTGFEIIEEIGIKLANI